VDVVGEAAGLTAMTGGEELVLGGAQVRAGQRLACQARVVGPVQVRIPGRY
jgi:ferredoxin